MDIASPTPCWRSLDRASTQEGRRFLRVRDIYVRRHFGVLRRFRLPPLGNSPAQLARVVGEVVETSRRRELFAREDHRRIRQQEHQRCPRLRRRAPGEM
jgi:hypothetical protein